MDLNAAMIFVGVVRAGTLSAASRKLSIPISTVSDKLVALEKELGVSLLTRTTRKLQLTEIGNEYFKKAESAIQILEDAKDDISRFQQSPRGLLKITAPPDFAEIEIAEAIQEYRVSFPDVHVEIHLSNRPVDMIREVYDIAIRGGHLDDSTFL
jgi:DNA-binding transcriptional LysR family regulator